MSERRAVPEPLALPESDAVERVVETLASTGHPVLDTLVVRGDYDYLVGSATSYTRVEFLYDADVVGVARVRLGRSEVSYVVRGGSRTRGLANARRWLGHLAPGAGGDVTPRHLHASNDDLRALTGAPEAARFAARELVRRLVREEVRLTGRVDADLGSLVALLTLEEGHDGGVATHHDAVRGIRLVGDLGAGAPVEWALRRFAAGGE